MHNSAVIQGDVRIQTGKAVNVLAQTNALKVTARSEASDTAASLVAMDVVLTHAKIEGMSTEASVDGNAQIQAGSVSIQAYGGTSGKVTQLISKAEVPTTSFSGVNSKLVRVYATRLSSPPPATLRFTGKPIPRWRPTPTNQPLSLWRRLADINSTTR